MITNQENLKIFTKKYKIKWIIMIYISKIIWVLIQEKDGLLLKEYNIY
jgi:hypothetical protein